MKRAPFVDLAFHRDPAAVQPHDFLRQCEAQAGARLFLHARIAAAVKLLEHLGQLVGRDADARVFDADLDVLVRMYGRETPRGRLAGVYFIALPSRLTSTVGDLVFVDLRLRHFFGNGQLRM